MHRQTGLRKAFDVCRVPKEAQAIWRKNETKAGPKKKKKKALPGEKNGKTGKKRKVWVVLFEMTKGMVAEGDFNFTPTTQTWVGNQKEKVPKEGTRKKGS